MDYLTNLVASESFRAVDPAEVLPVYRRARDLFEQRFYEAGGTACPAQPSSIYSVSDSDFDERGDVRAQSAQIVGLRADNLNRLVAKFLLPDTARDLEKAELAFFLQRVAGALQPVSLFHSITDNDLEQSISDYEDISYVDTLRELVYPTDEIREYYTLDVTDLVRSDYANDGETPLSAFRLQLADGAGGLYRFSLPPSALNRPQLILTFVPEPSAIMLLLAGALLAVHRRTRYPGRHLSTTL
jgi:hypothetical protein